MKKIFPKKLQRGSHVRVIAPSRSMALISPETRKIANANFEKMGLKLSFGKNVEATGQGLTASVGTRLADFHEAFADSNVDAILTVIGGFHSNQLLSYIDWDLIKKNPKIFCGFSDITALNNAIYAKTGLVNYSGPHYSTFGQKHYLEYTLEYFVKCLFENQNKLEIQPSREWTDDLWFLDQEDRHPVKNDGWWVINEGQAEGTILGANLQTFRLLQGTEFFPSLKNSILFLEDVSTSKLYDIDRELQSLIHLPDFSGVRGIVIGRFQKGSEISRDELTKMIKNKPELNNMPVVANLDFGHTEPRFTFPIGGEGKLGAGVKTTIVLY